MKYMKGFWVDAKWAPRPEISFSDYELKNKIAKRGCDAWKNISYSFRDNIPIPECKDTQVLIKVRTAGICGSDISIFEPDEEGYMSYASQCAFPTILGHEFTGEIVEIGSSVTNFHIGEYVTAENHMWCGECTYCRCGELNHCENMHVLGCDPSYYGTFAEYVVIDQKYCNSIDCLQEVYPDDSLFTAGIMIEPLACVYEGLFNTANKFRPGDYVVIFGAGGLGLAAIALMKTCGAAKIIVFEPEIHRRRLAKQMGADYILDPFDNIYMDNNILMELTRGQGVGLAIEASSSPARNFVIAERAIHVGGEFLCVSIAAQYPRMDYMKLVRRKITFSGAYGHAGHNNFRQIINLIHSKRIDMSPCITARFPLDHIPDALTAAASGIEGKVVVIP